MSRSLSPEQQAQWLQYFDSQLARPELSQVQRGNLEVRRRLVAEQSRIGTASEARRLLGLVAAPRMYTSNAASPAASGEAPVAGLAAAAVPVAVAADPSQTGGLQTLKQAIADNPLAATAAAVGTVGLVGAVAGGIAYSRRRKRKSKSGKRRRNSYRRRSVGARAGRGGGRKTRNRRGGAVRDRYKGKRVYRTKRGQPYILLRNGQARFVRA